MNKFVLLKQFYQIFQETCKLLFVCNCIIIEVNACLQGGGVAVGARVLGGVAVGARVLEGVAVGARVLGGVAPVHPPPGGPCPPPHGLRSADHYQH